MTDALTPPFDEADNMCPNCVTPWKCNGPHLDALTPQEAHPHVAKDGVCWCRPEHLDAAYQLGLAEARASADAELLALIQRWEASAKNIGDRTLAGGDPMRALSIADTLDGCADDLRALLEGSV